MTVQTPLTATGLAEQWLYQTLNADSALQALVGTQIYAGEAPQGATYPLVTFASLGGPDTTAPGFRRVLTQLRYAVHVADRVGSIALIDQISARVDALLHGKTYQWPNGGGYQLGCQRERQMVMSAAVAGVATRELVSTYLLVLQEAGDV